jgi:hypothetical protein
MLSLVNLLIIFFILLIVYQLLTNIYENHILEGMDNQAYQPYDTNNPANVLILAQQNAGNIIVLKQQIDSVMGLDKEVKDISGNVQTLQDQVTQLIQANQKYTSSMIGTTPPNITGATSS